MSFIDSIVVLRSVGFSLFLVFLLVLYFFFFFFTDTASTEIYTLSLHDALPISGLGRLAEHPLRRDPDVHRGGQGDRIAQCRAGDRKSTRLNSSHQIISYAVFCLKKKKKKLNIT